MSAGVYKRLIGINCGKGINPGSAGKCWEWSKKAKTRMKGVEKSEDSKLKMSKAKIGIRLSEKHKKNISLAHKGLHTKEKNIAWKGGISFELYGEEFTKELKEQIKKMKQGVLEEKKKDEFEKELAGLINKYSLESLSNTPDYILAEYLRDCLEIFCYAVNDREKWFGRKKDSN